MGPTSLPSEDPRELAFERLFAFRVGALLVADTHEQPTSRSADDAPPSEAHTSKPPEVISAAKVKPKVWLGVAAICQKAREGSGSRAAASSSSFVRSGMRRNPAGLPSFAEGPDR